MTHHNHLAHGVSAAPESQRSLSVDTLRGLGMFCVVVVDFIVDGMLGLSDADPIAFLADQMEHVAWSGFHFSDLVFPLFVFMSGISLVFSMSRSLSEHGRARTIAKVFRRALLLYLLGLFYFAKISTSGASLRYVGSLQRIAFCYLVTALLFSLLKIRGLAIAFLACLLGYWALMTFVPVPGFGAGNFEEGKNLSDWIDSQYLPGLKSGGAHDSEGLLSHISAVSTTLIGVFAGLLLRNPKVATGRKVRWLIAAGIVCACAGWLWHLQFPVIKKVWTSSFVLVAGGYSLGLLALFYWVIDIRKKQRWALPFVWMGTNSIAIYMMFNVINFGGVSARIVKGPVREALGSAAPMVQAILILTMVFAFVRFLYHRKIFLRV